jgi:hypothetical protein
VLINNSSFPDVPFDVVVDDSAGLVANDATMNYYPAAWPPDRFTGFAAPGVELTMPKPVSRIVYKAPRGLDNALQLDLGRRPEGAGDSLPTLDFEYDGGGDGSPGNGGRLTLEGSEGYDWFASEVNTATGPGAGSIVVTRAGGRRQRVGYNGLAADGLIDFVAATDYRFDYQGADDPGVAVSDSEDLDARANPQRLQIASRAASPAFVATTIAEKENIAIYTNGTRDIATKVDYTSDKPFAGLASLTIVTSPNDEVDAVATPPDAAFAVQTTAAPRPEPVAPPVEPTPVEPTTAAPTTVAQPVQPATELPPAGPVAPVRVEEGSTAWDAPTSQVVGAGFAARFGTVMRTGPPPRGSVHAASPFRRLRAARRGQFQALRARRVERSPAMVPGFGNARAGAPSPFDGRHVDLRMMRVGGLWQNATDG